jgi:heptosyltransferase-2
MQRAVTVPKRLVVLAPNWLGDAVMALPLIADVRRAWPDTTIAVAARPSVAPVFAMVPAVDDTLVLEAAAAWRTISPAPANVRTLAAGGFDAALLLPNSFQSAALVRRAGISERWGFAADLRGWMLTKAIPRMRKYGHQVEYYQRLGEALGVATGDPFAGVVVPDDARSRAAALLAGRGLPAGRRFVVMAPGAAYGRAKQWLPERFAELAASLAEDAMTTLLVGTKADRPACAEIARLTAVIDLSGHTDLPTLAGVLATASHVIANDSGAMHLAAAVGARVTAIFGPTNDRRTAPLAASATAPRPVVVSTDVWCRPCMLRECPIDHRCMTHISAARVQVAMNADGAQGDRGDQGDRTGQDRAGQDRAGQDHRSP